MPWLHYFSRLDLYCNPVPDNGIYFLAAICAPIGQAFTAIRITKVSNDFLNDKMFESFTVFSRSSQQFLTMKQIVGDACVKVIEFWGLHLPAFERKFRSLFEIFNENFGYHSKYSMKKSSTKVLLFFDICKKKTTKLHKIDDFRTLTAQNRQFRVSVTAQNRFSHAAKR